MTIIIYNIGGPHNYGVIAEPSNNNYTIIVQMELGKSFGNMENMAVVNMAVPTPSAVLSEIHTKTNTQGVSIFTTNLKR